MYLSHTDSKIEIFKSIRLIMSIAFISIIDNLTFRIDYIYLHTGLGEISLTESLQLVALIITFINFIIIGKNNQHLKHATFLIAGFFTVLFIRELDFLFDYIVHGFWIYPALFVTIIACLYAYQAKKGIILEMAYLLQKPYMKLVLIGVALLLFFTRLYGMANFWSQVMTEHYLRDVKTISEEGTELLCYSLIALGAVNLKKTLK
ncbi:hypothetical protein L4D77_22480 [Photobacterium frigidiphilum]|uniref:hypothetical protein n=1 Tax=Photobacterium frigidiphilum TaxID=264736 RepID=UPI003D0CD1D9